MHREPIYRRALEATEHYGTCAREGRDCRALLDAVFNACVAEHAPLQEGFAKPPAGFPPMPAEVEAADRLPRDAPPPQQQQQLPPPPPPPTTTALPHAYTPPTATTSTGLAVPHAYTPATAGPAAEVWVEGQAVESQELQGGGPPSVGL